ncbi:unnamed protein product [Prorocentrum cordatum]|uniref:Uncharacterized protein n=1 Tax=Prorocentrum cordatum TaxID=2364126 RepID=A0ABN9S5G8_9DINO|nr:unnamed protein product [Polarella glacialis]
MRAVAARSFLTIARGDARLMAARGASVSSPARPMLRGAVFDMDGTLTVPNLDFKAMYQRCGVPLSEDLLASVANMPAADAAAASAVIEEMEEEGRRTLALESGVKELAVWLRFHGVPTALVTRNSARTVEHLHDKLWVPAGIQSLASGPPSAATTGRCRRSRTPARCRPSRSGGAWPRARTCS